MQRNKGLEHYEYTEQTLYEGKPLVFLSKQIWGKCTRIIPVLQMEKALKT